VIVAGINLFEARPAAFVVFAIGVLAVGSLPRLLRDKAVSFPIPLLLLGAAFFALPLGLTEPDPLRHGPAVELLTELLVIVALTNAGLRIDRPFSWRTWSTTWRLLGVTMPLTVAGVTAVGAWLVGLPLEAALLAGAALSPTDPVLASEVQVGGPGEDEEEDEVRFALTSEAGLNDALAFPYTHAAILLAAGSPDGGEWLTTWLLGDVVYRLAVGVAAGLVIGRLLAQVLFRLPAETETAKAMAGVAALAVTLGAYGATEWFGGYGFLATFVAAHALRHVDAEHEYHEKLVIFVEQVERVLVVAVMVLLGGAVVGGAVDVTWPLVGAAALIVLVVRPVAGLVGLVAGRASLVQAGVISFFGIRGVGSFFYVAYALNHARFPEADAVWSLVLLVALASIVLHGITAAPVLRWVDDREH